MKRKKLFLLMVTTVCMIIPGKVYANEEVLQVKESDVIGGWDEDIGYFVNEGEYLRSLNEKESNVIEEKSAAKSTVKHTGERERSDEGGTTHFRAHGWTTWEGVYHYTRARMEEESIIFGDRVLTDSGRIWGTSGTEAISPWWYFDPTVNEKARTYYGNKK